MCFWDKICRGLGGSLEHGSWSCTLDSAVSAGPVVRSAAYIP